MHNLTKTVFHLSSVVFSVFISGCVLAPGTSSRTSQISGRVLNAATHIPVSGALVVWHDMPKLRHATTDMSGRFVLKGSRNFHLFVWLGICGPDYNMLSHVGPELDITHPAFQGRRFNPYDHNAHRGETSEGHYFVESQDILLCPNRH